MFSFSSFCKNSLDREKESFPWCLEVCVGCIPQWDRAALENRTNKGCRGRDPAERDSPSSWSLHSPCKHCRLLWPSHCPSWLRVQARSEKIRAQPSGFSATVGFAAAWVGVDRNPGQGCDKGGDGGRVARSIRCLIRQEEQGVAFPPLLHGSVHHSAHSALEK